MLPYTESRAFKGIDYKASLPFRVSFIDLISPVLCVIPLPLIALAFSVSHTVSTFSRLWYESVTVPDSRVSRIESSFFVSVWNFQVRRQLCNMWRPFRTRLFFSNIFDYGPFLWGQSSFSVLVSNLSSDLWCSKEITIVPTTMPTYGHWWSHMTNSTSLQEA